VKTVWVTRTLPGAEVTGGKVRAAGFEPLVAPLLEVVFEPGGEIDVTGVAALAFTSANGVRAFATRSPERRLPVFVVGRATAAAARNAGFVTVTASDGDVFTLARGIPHGGLVLHAGAAEPAADLVLALKRRGVAARGIVVYRTERTTLSDAVFAAAAASDFVLLQSAKAARAFRQFNFDRPHPICQSTAIASLLPLRATVSAHAPNEAALLAGLIEAAR
jgi:uroporphyrinogen-III synthase